VTKTTNKFTEYLKETVEIHMLKFLPSQYILVFANPQRAKIMYNYNFRDQSKEDEYSDLSQNLWFLQLLNYHIQKLEKEGLNGRSRKGEDTNRPFIKSTHSGTKSKMNQHIDSAEDRKNSDEDSEYFEIMKENKNTFEFTISGFVIR